MLIILSGLPGVGKTTVGRLVAERLRAAYIRIDAIEQTLLQAGTAGPIGPEGYLIAYRVAADNLALGLYVVADCVNASELPRIAWRKVAQEHGCAYLFVQLVCSDRAEHKRRTEQRKADLPGHVLPSWSSIENMRFAAPPADALVLDTARILPEQAADEVIRRACRANT